MTLRIFSKNVIYNAVPNKNKYHLCSNLQLLLFFFNYNSQVIFKLNIIPFTYYNCIRIGSYYNM